MGSKNYSVGVDLGATKIIAAVFDDKMKALSQCKAKTPSDKGGDAVAAAIVSLIQETCGEAELDGQALTSIGVAVPAPIDQATGIVINAPNMGLSNYPLGKKISAALGSVPVFLCNDVQAGLWGEVKLGALLDYQNAVGIFVGTGIGGGLLINGQLWRGSHGHAGEIGHMILEEGGPACGCGQYGCYEALASRTAMAKDAVMAASSGKSPIFASEAGGDFKKYKSSVFAKALEGKDESATRIVSRSAFWTGVAMANLVNAFDPEAIVLGGGIMPRFGEFYRKKALESMTEHLPPAFAKGVKVLLSELGDLAVPSGAALLAKSETEKEAGAGKQSVPAKSK
jgi:glucokinase